MVGENRLSVVDKEFAHFPVSMSNPHCVNFVNDLNSVPLAKVGPAIETPSILSRKTNVEFVQVLAQRR